MSHSKNDFPIMGGTGRQVTKPYRGSYDAFYKLINPNTKKPYTMPSWLRNWNIASRNILSSPS